MLYLNHGGDGANFSVGQYNDIWILNSEVRSLPSRTRHHIQSLDLLSNHFPHHPQNLAKASRSPPPPSPTMKIEHLLLLLTSALSDNAVPARTDCGVTNTFAVTTCGVEYGG